MCLESQMMRASTLWGGDLVYALFAWCCNGTWSPSQGDTVLPHSHPYMAQLLVPFHSTPPLISNLLQQLEAAAMALKNPTSSCTLLFFCCCFSTILVLALCRPGIGEQVAHSNSLPPKKDNRSPLRLESRETINKEGSWRWRDTTSARRLMIGSTAPICTYNECRGCQFKCSAEQVPVDAGDPMNSAYRYKCVCHR